MEFHIRYNNSFDAGLLPIMNPTGPPPSQLARAQGETGRGGKYREGEGKLRTVYNGLVTIYVKYYSADGLILGSAMFH